MPDASPGGRPRRATSRDLVNAIFYMLRSRQAWRLLPQDFPPWKTVYYNLRHWQGGGRSRAASARETLSSAKDSASIRRAASESELRDVTRRSHAASCSRRMIATAAIPIASFGEDS